MSAFDHRRLICVAELPCGDYSMNASTSSCPSSQISTLRSSRPTLPSLCHHVRDRVTPKRLWRQNVTMMIMTIQDASAEARHLLLVRRSKQALRGHQFITHQAKCLVPQRARQVLCSPSRPLKQLQLRLVQLTELEVEPRWGESTATRIRDVAVNLNLKAALQSFPFVCPFVVPRRASSCKRKMVLKRKVYFEFLFLRQRWRREGAILLYYYYCQPN